MKQYVCNTTFTTHRGYQYVKGDKIYEDEFFRLSTSDRTNFAEVRSDMEEFTLPPSKNRKRMHDDEDNLRPMAKQDDDDDFSRRAYQASSAEIDEIFGGAGSNDNIDYGGNDFGGGDSGGGGASDDY